MRISFADVFGLRPEQQDRPAPAVGDLVSTGRNRHPRYTVMAIIEDRAWIRGLAHGRDHVVPLGRLRKLDEA